MSKSTITAYCYISTVVENEKKFHRREVLQAQKVGELYRRLCWPSQSTLEHLISTNQIQNCPFTVADVKRFFYIYGLDAATLKGKTKKRHGDRNPPPTITTLPDAVLAVHRDVKLSADIFFLQGIPFLTTISDKIKFRTAVRLLDRDANTLFDELMKVIAVYEARGFVVTVLRGDNEFRPLQHRLLAVKFEGCAADDHIPVLRYDVYQGLIFFVYVAKLISSLYNFELFFE